MHRGDHPDADVVLSLYNKSFGDYASFMVGMEVEVICIIIGAP